MSLEPQTTIYKWMFGETTIFYIKIWNHPIEATIYKWLALGFQEDDSNHVDLILLDSKLATWQTEKL